MDIFLPQFLPGYYEVTNYRRLFPLLGYEILADHATRRDGGEIHLVFFRHGWRFGFVIFHDEYDETYCPMFCESGETDSFRQFVEDRIRWFNSVEECLDFFQATVDEREQDRGFWFADRVGRDNPKLVTAFLNDIFSILNTLLKTQ